MKRILTFDIEEWFHLLEFPPTQNADKWRAFEPRIHQNMDTIFELLDRSGSTATFFCLGWIARQYPEIIKRIDRQGYEIGTHSDLHQLVYRQNRKECFRDLQRSIFEIEDLTGKKVRCYRAPGFSLREDTLWLFEFLIDLGIEFDCSVFSGRHAHGYYLLFPCPRIKKWIRESDYVMTYFHPRDFDPGQPIIRELSLVRKFKSYIGLRECAKKVQDMLKEFEFADIAAVDQYIDWEKMPVKRFSANLNRIGIERVPGIRK